MTTEETVAAMRSLLAPKSIAIVGASERSLPAVGILDALSAYSYNGDLWLINQRGEPIRNRPVLRSAADLPPGVDLALIVVPSPAVPAVVGECAAAGVGAAVVFSSGFAEIGAVGQRLQTELIAAIADTQLRLLGPNCEGFLNVTDGIPASFSSSISLDQVAMHFGSAPTADVPKLARGPVAVVGQSGGLVFSVFNRGLRRGLRFSHVIATGNEADLDIQDVLEFLLEDELTTTIIVYLEGLQEASRFPAIAARAQAVGTTLIVGKVGRSSAAARAVLSHTGHLAGDDAMYQAIFDRYGVIAVRDPEEMIDVALAISLCPAPMGSRTAIVSLSGGSAVWMADACEEAGLQLPELQPATRSRLAGLLPSYASIGNPVDVGGMSQTPPAAILSLVAGDPEIDSLILVTTLANPERLEVDLPALNAIKRGSKPVLLHSYTDPTATTLLTLNDIGIPLYLNPRRCVNALRALTQVAKPTAVDSPWPVDAQALREVADQLAGTGPSVPEHRAKELLAVAGIPVGAERLTVSADDAAVAAAEMGFPVALKVQSPDIPHKAAAGGVALPLNNATNVRAAYAAILAAVRAGQPDARLDGVLVQRMIDPGVELIVGIHCSPDFGPMIVVGLGGALVEVLNRRVIYPAPIGPSTAQALLARLGLTPSVGELTGISHLVSAVSSLAAALPSTLLELDLNPVVWYPRTGECTVVDALAVVRQERER